MKFLGGSYYKFKYPSSEPLRKLGPFLGSSAKIAPFSKAVLCDVALMSSY